MTKLTTCKPFAFITTLLLSLVIGCGDAPSTGESDDPGASHQSTTAAPGAQQAPADQQADDGEPEGDDAPARLDRSQGTPDQFCLRQPALVRGGGQPDVCADDHELLPPLKEVCLPKCQPGFDRHGSLCTNPQTNETYDREVGVAPTCDLTRFAETIGRLCYVACPEGLVTNGLQCVSTCPASHPISCSADTDLCAASTEACNAYRPPTRQQVGACK